MLRRRLALPHSEAVPALCAMLLGERVEPADADRFLEAIAYHRLIGPAAAAVDAGRLLVPERPAQTLRDTQAMSVLRAALLRRELAAIAAPLAAACAAEPILIKGPAVADRFYPDPQLRAFGDLDLLVPRERLGAASSALAPFGYAEQVELRAGFGATHGHDLHLTRMIGRKQAHVELHWRIGDDRLGEALSHAALASQAETIDIGGGAIACPSPPDQLLVLSLHLLSDRLKRLAWIEDVRLVAGSLDDAAWAASFERARDLGLLWVLHRALAYARHYLGFERAPALPCPDPPPFGPLRAVEGINLRASLHIGRLAAMPWRERPRYLRDVLVPSAEGLRGTVGDDGAPTWRLALRHLGRTASGFTSRRR